MRRVTGPGKITRWSAPPDRRINAHAVEYECMKLQAVLPPRRASSSCRSFVVMAAPLDAPYRSGVLGHSFRGAVGSPHELLGRAGALSGARLRCPVDVGMAAIEARLRMAPGALHDRGGVDSYPTHSARAANNRLWAGPRVWPLLDLRSEAAAGVDGEWPLPFALRLLTRPATPAAAP